MRVLFAALVVVGFASQASAQLREPRFAKYPVPVYRGPIAQEAKMSADIDEDVRLRLSDSFTNKSRVTAAGRYILVTWSCGTACVSSAFVDAQSGDVVWSPGSVSDWKQVYRSFAAVVAKPNSKLVVFQGAINERGVVGRHFYLLEDGKLTHLRSTDTKGIFRSKPR